ncbi:MAG: hypothetical protein ACK5PB_01375 [Pirellula sp.]
MTRSEPPLQVIQKAIISPDTSFSGGIDRFTCGDRFAITVDDWLILIAHQSFHFSQSHSTNDWKASIKPLPTNSELTLFEVMCGDVVVANAAKLAPFRPLATLLRIGGTPPESIQKDWRRQLAKTGKSLPNVCRTLCHPDGILMVIPDLDLVTARIGSSRTPNADQNQIPTKTLDKFGQWKSISWPWLSPKSVLDSSAKASTLAKVSADSSETPNDLDGIPTKIPAPIKLGKISTISNAPPSGAAASGTSNIKTPPGKNGKQKKTSKRTIVIAGSLSGATLLTAALIWNSLPESSPTTKITAAPVSELPAPQKDSPAESNHDVVEPAAENLDVSRDADMTELASSNSLPSLDSLTSDLDSFSKLEVQLQNKVVIDELDTSNIIARSLNVDKPDPQAPNSDLASSSSNTASFVELGTTMPEMLNSETVEDDATDQATQDEAIAPDAVAVNAKRKDKLSAASKREKVSVGFFVVPKDAGWSAQLLVEDPVPETLVVSPDDMTRTVGPGKVTWTLGFEEEDPELVVELVAKPGRRWEIIWQVGFRELPDVPARLIGPNDATSVLRQLVSAKSFVGRMLTQNQVARDSGIRGPVDLFEQRRQLQRQDRELEQAIERWKTIELLSRVVFQQTQVEFEATPPAAPQEDVPTP